MLDRGRFVENDQTGHPRFNDEPVVAFQMQDDALAEAADGENFLPYGAAAKPIQAGADRDRFAPAGEFFNIGQVLPHDWQQAPSHCFDFR